MSFLPNIQLFPGRKISSTLCLLRASSSTDGTLLLVDGPGVQPRRNVMAFSQSYLAILNGMTGRLHTPRLSESTELRRRSSIIERKQLSTVQSTVCRPTTIPRGSKGRGKPSTHQVNGVARASAQTTSSQRSRSGSRGYWAPKAAVLFFQLRRQPRRL